MMGGRLVDGANKGGEDSIAFARIHSRVDKG
jgi:hypothetical protein